MIRSLVILATLALGLTSHALPSLKCITGGLPTTSFLLDERADHVQLQVIHSNGVGYAPIFTGTATLKDLAMIQKNGEFIAGLGERFSILFKKEKCRFEEEKFLTCSLNQETEIAGVKLNRVYFTTSESVDKIPGFEFTKTNVRLSLRQGSQEYNMEMSYYGSDCLITGAK